VPSCLFGDVRYRQIKLILNAALDREPLPDTQPMLPVLSHTFAAVGKSSLVGAHDVAPAVPQAAQLKLSGILNTLDVRVNQAVDQQLAHWSFWLYSSTMIGTTQPTTPGVDALLPVVTQ